MSPQTIAEIILASLKLTILIVEGQTPAQRAKFWDQHIAFVDWVQRVSGITPKPAVADKVERPG